MRVLLVEDETRLANAVRRGLEAEGFSVDVAADGKDGFWRASEGRYDAIVLDIMLPGMNGFRVCSALREAGHWTPILMLTAKDGELDEAEALDTGADDFLTKPFSFVVLTARLRALLRRGAPAPPAVPTARGPPLHPPPPPARRGPRALNPTGPGVAPPPVPPRPGGPGTPQTPDPPPARGRRARPGHPRLRRRQRQVVVHPGRRPGRQRGRPQRELSRHDRLHLRLPGGGQPPPHPLAAPRPRPAAGPPGQLPGAGAHRADADRAGQRDRGHRDGTGRGDGLRAAPDAGLRRPRRPHPGRPAGVAPGRTGL